MSEILDPGSPGPDVIKLEGLRLLCTLGMHEWERHVNREVCLDLALHIDISAAAASDKIEDAVDYSGVIKRISEFVIGSKFKLIEALAEGIAAECLSLPGVTRVDLKVEKVGASEIASRVAVEITRPRLASS
ncbi:MAG: dihydroneopterin aldolase [Chloroflexi bacterium]|nr:dihydroneopterin aldolase [Chloroflexota bacterium]